MTAKKLVAKAAGEAAKASGNVTTGAVAVAASTALWNPVPLLVWGVGSTIWVFLAATSERYQRRILDAEREAVRRHAEEQYQELEASLIELLENPSVVALERADAIPNYLERYRRLVRQRDHVVDVGHRRKEVAIDTEMGMLAQLSYLLTAFLRLARARVMYQQILIGDPLAVPAKAPAKATSEVDPPRQVRERRRTTPPPRVKYEAAMPPVKHGTFADRIANLETRIHDLGVLAEQQPTTLSIRQSHIDILQRRMHLLQECQRRDQRIAAQLDVFPDAFAVILERVTATEFNAEEVVNYMGSMVQQVEETEKFVESLQPFTDDMLKDLDFASWATHT